MSQITYKDSGVDRSVGETAKDSIKEYARSTHSSQVLKGIGLFSGFFEPDLSGYEKPVLVSSVDGVGTKVKIAEMVKRYDSIGHDLVNHSINDIMVCGAKPLFFMDYLAADKLQVEVVTETVRGIAEACKAADCALIGGETAEMPGVYAKGNFDVAGAIVGVVDKEDIIDGSLIAAGDTLIGIASSGLHTNGYSLARKVFFEYKKYPPDYYLTETSTTVADELLITHKSYYKLITAICKTDGLHGISHITGGGIVDNTERLLRPGLSLQVEWNSWQRLPIFDIIQREGNVPESDMRDTFNLGVGLILIANQNTVDGLLHHCEEVGERATIIGKVVTE